ncbi:SrfA family protein [Azomonas macrocytogenes]|uniref:Breakpoint cluster region protein n=1 Tax=Azomonas macrocytogenes TaxID=69962 RepID=A0A839T0C0_AZOMA|nr:SrfA family protein [Azomonas macrocytogenes]MBB3103007.1 hypothetical protein [Azomonas macrocytogenes]
MPGALLRTGTLQEFKALGVDGQPVYSVALQLREAIRLKMRREAADCLAIPQPNETGDRIDWYAPFEGDVVPWSAAIPEERKQAFALLEEMQAGLRATSESMRGDVHNREKQVFGRLLEKALQFPDAEHVYLVDGKPVITFWGFSDERSPEGQDSLSLLRPVAPAPAPTSAAPMPPPIASATAVAVTSSRWRRWLWLLLLPLLLLLLLWLMRACAPTVELPLGLSQIDLPGLPAVQERNVDLHGGTVNVEGSSSVNATGDGTIQPGTGDGDLETENGLPAGEDTPPGPDGAGQEDGKGAEEPKDGEQPPADGQKPGEKPQVPPPPPELPKDAADKSTQDKAGQKPMNIPPEAQKNGSTDFLDGNWRAGAGIQDAKTGKPLQLDYDFGKDGKGKVGIRRGDGVQCSGAVSASMKGGNLAITNQGQATCSDGSTYKLPEVVCAPDAKSTADCTGSYDNQKFPMSMRQGGQ